MKFNRLRAVEVVALLCLYGVFQASLLLVLFLEFQESEESTKNIIVRFGRHWFDGDRNWTSPSCSLQNKNFRLLQRQWRQNRRAYQYRLNHQQFKNGLESQQFCKIPKVKIEKNEFWSIRNYSSCLHWIFSWLLFKFWAHTFFFIYSKNRSYYNSMLWTKLTSTVPLTKKPTITKRYLRTRTFLAKSVERRGFPASHITLMF